MQNEDDNWKESVPLVRKYLSYVTLLRVGIPASVWSTLMGFMYPQISLILAAAINDSNVFNVVANDYSQFIQNILTTSGLTFSLLVGNTYYFLYQQQECELYLGCRCCYCPCLHHGRR